MLCVAIQIYRNILSSQCYIRYVDDSNSVDSIQVECFSSELEFLLLKNCEIVKKIKIIAPSDLFVPSSLSSDNDYSVNSGSTVVCRTTFTPTGQSIAECSFRLQISGADKLDQSESEIKVNVKDFFKERFENPAYWDLLCLSCGVRLPVKPLFIQDVREYCESELSEGWFCHGNGPQPAHQPSSQILYFDETSFYLYPSPDPEVNCKITSVLDLKCCDSSNVSRSDASGIDCSNISPADYCDSENIDPSNCQGRNSFDFPTTRFEHGQGDINLAALNLKSAGVINKDGVDEQVLVNSFDSNMNSSCLKRADSLIGSSIHHACDDYKLFAVDKNDCLNSSKVLCSAIECQSCGDILSSEKSSIPFIRFYFDKLVFKNSSFNDDHLEYAHKITLLSFWNLVRKNQNSLLPSKLLLQSKVRGEELSLLLWIPSAPVAQFLLRDPLEDIPLEIDLETEPVYKVLYFVGTSGSEHVRSWRHDFAVDFYQVSDSMVKTLVGILDASSSHFPKASEAGGFSCGFIQAPS